ncbi:MAG: acyl-CoA thioesterase [Bacteroidia bacterium]|nr:acyl-CoA thioesterase [Bacteroidia bacterium]
MPGLSPHITPLQIRFSDLDRLGHVNNAVFLQYMETSRVEYFNLVLGPRHNWQKFGFVVARNEIDYLLPIYLNDEIFCSTRCLRIGNKSLTIENVIYKKQKRKKLVAARGVGILVAMDYQSMKSIPLPDAWVKKIRDFEKKSLK